MAAKNDITGDSIQSRGTSDAYRNNYDLVFSNKKVKNSDTDIVKEKDDAEETKT